MFEEKFPRLKIGICANPVSGGFIDKMSKFFDFQVCSIPEEKYPDIGAYIFESDESSGNSGEILPMESIARLEEDAEIRESFLTRIYRYHDWKIIQKKGVRARDLVNFQAEQKYLIMAYDQQNAKILGRMVAESGRSENLAALADEFIELTMEVLSEAPSRRRHSNALHHIMGYLRKQIDTDAKEELLNCIRLFEEGEISLGEPIDLLKSHFRTHPNEYIMKQRYLSPFPVGLRKT